MNLLTEMAAKVALTHVIYLDIKMQKALREEYDKGACPSSAEGPHPAPTPRRKRLLLHPRDTAVA